MKQILIDQGSGVNISEYGGEEPEQAAVQTLKCALQAIWYEGVPLQ